MEAIRTALPVILAVGGVISLGFSFATYRATRAMTERTQVRFDGVMTRLAEVLKEVQQK